MDKNIGYYDMARTEILPFIQEPTKKVLDVGCGSGAFLELVKDTFNSDELWGVEINAAASDLAKAKFENIICGNISDAIGRLPDNYFDWIFFNDVIEHLPEPEAVIREIKKKLNQNGKIFFSIPNVRYYKVIKQLLFSKDWRYGERGVLDYTHLRYFTKRSIIRMLKKSNLVILKIKGINCVTKIGSRLFCEILNLLTLGYYVDIRYPQYAVVVKVQTKEN